MNVLLSTILIFMSLSNVDTKPASSNRDKDPNLGQTDPYDVTSSIHTVLKTLVGIIDDSSTFIKTIPINIVTGRSFLDSPDFDGVDDEDTTERRGFINLFAQNDKLLIQFNFTIDEIIKK